MGTQMKRKWTALHIAGIVIGGYVVLTEIISNVEHIIQGTGSYYNPAVFLVIGVSVGTVFAFSMAMNALEEWRKLSSWINAIGLFVAFFFGAAFTLSTTLDRTATARDNQLVKVWQSDEQLNTYVKTHSSLSAQASKECATGRGRRCEDITQEIVLLNEKIKNRRSELDSMGKRIAMVMGGAISAETMSIIQPMFMPISMFLMGIFMVAYGLKGRLVAPEFQQAIELKGKELKEDTALRFIREYKQKNGRCPTVKQVMTVAQVSYVTAKKYIDKSQIL